MKSLLQYLVTQLVDKPEAIQITEEVDPHGTIKLSLKVDELDMGKIIGKKGKIIHALRLLLRVKAIKTQQRVFLEIIEPSKQNSSTS